MIENDLLLIITLVWFTLSVMSAAMIYYHLITIREARQARDEHIKNLRELQAWLFDQLYNMAPGKVLKPNETEGDLIIFRESKPAVVIHTSRDPMNEFKGKRDDWRE